MKRLPYHALSWQSATKKQLRDVEKHLEIVIKAQGLSKQYENVLAVDVDHIDLEVLEGEICCQLLKVELER